MDEIEYKLNTNNNVLVVNAIDKLISTIKSKFKPAERQKFVVENEELRFLKEKCSSTDKLVSLTACQGLLALVQLGVLEIGHTMSTVITLLPSAHNYSAIISTMAGLLTLDLKSRLVPGQPYTCQFNLRSPQHPFISVLERNKAAQDDVFAQMHALCTHPDQNISSNSLELLRPVFLWLTCNCSQLAAGSSSKPWRLLLGLPPSAARQRLLLACLAGQQISNAKLLSRAMAAYSAVTEAAIFQQDQEQVVALLPFLARLSVEMLAHGLDPRACYSLMGRCAARGGHVAAGAAAGRSAPLGAPASLCLALLADNLHRSPALHLHELLNLCLDLITRCECSVLSMNTFAASALQWLHLPSLLTAPALHLAAQILDTQARLHDDTTLYMPNIINNNIFNALLYTDGHLSLVYNLHRTWERFRDEPEKLNEWFDDMKDLDDDVKVEMLPFFLGVLVNRRDELVGIKVKVVGILVGVVGARREVGTRVLPVLVHAAASDGEPRVKMACLKALPAMAATKENVPTVVSVLSKLRTGRGAPTSFLIHLYTSLAHTQPRCFPYLQQLLVETGGGVGGGGGVGAGGGGRPDDLRWEVDIARAQAVHKICHARASSHGLELVPVISSILNKCTGADGAGATGLALGALGALWAGGAVAPPGTWRALEPKLGRDRRTHVQISICELLGGAPALRTRSPEYEALVSSAARRLWAWLAHSHDPRLVQAACEALGNYTIQDYKLKDVPEVYRRTVKLPASYCKTPADAARPPEDVLDYIPGEIWPEVFKYTNQAALGGVRRLAEKLIDREIRAYRSGVYQPDARVEPRDMSYLPATSVVRSLMDFLRKQITSPTHDTSEKVLLSILETLGAEYPKPLPPVDVCWVHDAYHRGERWRTHTLTLAARLAPTAGSARRFVENYLENINDKSEESDILLVFSLLPILCRGVPPNALRPPVEIGLRAAHQHIAHVKAKGRCKEEDDPEQYLFVKLLRYMREALECERIHDANRTLLARVLEGYFTVLEDDHVAWPAYVDTCCALPTDVLERMTSPSGWWETAGGALRRAGALRGAAGRASPTPLVWINELVIPLAAPEHQPEQEYCLECMVGCLQSAAARPQDPAGPQWLLQLMARTQVAFNEMEELSSKLFLCDVFMLAVIVLSGQWGAVRGARRGGGGAGGGRRARGLLLPQAAAALVGKAGYKEIAPQLLEWLAHTRARVPDVQCARACQRALLASRHAPAFAHTHMWKRLESHMDLITSECTDQ